MSRPGGGKSAKSESARAGPAETRLGKHNAKVRDNPIRMMLHLVMTGALRLLEALRAGPRCECGDRPVTSAPRPSRTRLSPNRLDCSPARRSGFRQSRTTQERLRLAVAGPGTVVGAVLEQIARLAIENFADFAERIEAHPADLA